jgi:peroxiredoxin Q/BCP
MSKTEVGKKAPQFTLQGTAGSWSLSDAAGSAVDAIESHEKFKRKMAFPFELLSDPDKKVCKLYDVIQEKSMYGKKFLGIERSTFLIDGKGQLRQVWRKVKVNGHAAEVLAAVKAL